MTYGQFNRRLTCQNKMNKENWRGRMKMVGEKILWVMFWGGQRTYLLL